MGVHARLADKEAKGGAMDESRIDLAAPDGPIPPEAMVGGEDFAHRHWITRPQTPD